MCMASADIKSRCTFQNSAIASPEVQIVVCPASQWMILAFNPYGPGFKACFPYGCAKPDMDQWKSLIG